MEMREGFRKRLREIQDDILVMGSMVEKAILHSVNALKDRDMATANQVIANDEKINQNQETQYQMHRWKLTGYELH